MDNKNKKIWVAGLGKSGKGIVESLIAEGAQVIASDGKEAAAFDADLQKRWESAGVQLRFAESFTELPAGDIDLIVTSPGLSINLPVFQTALQAGIEVIGEIEYACRKNPSAKIIAISGTNGKTTTTTLIGEICKRAGLKTAVAGNIGMPLVDVIDKDYDVFVVEISSFQMETAAHFHPHVSLILNITPDHLDRHGDMATYAMCKAKMLQNQTEEDFAVLNCDDELIEAHTAGYLPSRILFSHSRKEEASIFYEDGFIFTLVDGKPEKYIAAEEIMIKGMHNIENSMAAIGAAMAFGISDEMIKDTLRTFPGVEHRLEPVRTLNGVRFVNDSKGTNSDASIKAIEAFPDPIILIAGGKDKGVPFDSFIAAFGDKVKHLVTIGQAAEKIETAASAGGFSRFTRAADMEDAVKKAFALAVSGDIVLLSPACASFDMFNSFEHRGEVFKTIVNQLNGECDAQKKA